MAKYNDRTTEALINAINKLCCDEDIKNIINHTNELKGNDKLVDALLDYGMLFEVCGIIDDEPLFDLDLIGENISACIISAIEKEDREGINSFIKELIQLIHLNYDYIVFHLLGYFSEVMDIDMRDYTSSILEHLDFDIEKIDKDIDELYYLDAVNKVASIDESSEDFEFEQVCYEASEIIVGLMNKDIKLSEVRFSNNY